MGGNLYMKPNGCRKLKGILREEKGRKFRKFGERYRGGN